MIRNIIETIGRRDDNSIAINGIKRQYRGTRKLETITKRESLKRLFAELDHTVEIEYDNIVFGIFYYSHELVKTAQVYIMDPPNRTKMQCKYWHCENNCVNYFDVYFFQHRHTYSEEKIKLENSMVKYNQRRNEYENAFTLMDKAMRLFNEYRFVWDDTDVSLVWELYQDPVFERLFN